MKRTTFVILLALIAFVLPAFSAPGEADGYLSFLYKYMSLPDSLDRTEAFYRANVEASLRARHEMPWGKDVPEREFRHFVLPVRVNNEETDMSRLAFYEELKDRVKGLSMEQAALEINHWCHEKVTYRPSDARTLAPSATLLTAWGRCGEESTFAVAALRAMCIPARQIYTPRWAHTDDNHAWVEVWTDGRWHFLGACEPMPLLNMAWFNAPAARGMVMATNVHGRYEGSEEVLMRRRLTTRINVTDNYAPVDTLRIRVTDSQGHASAGATVMFCLYNYAEFYPVVSRKADSQGRARLTAGRGDMVVWASDGTHYGWKQATVGAEREVTVVMDKSGDYRGTADMTIVPPRQSGKLPVASPEAVAKNTQRLVYEDSIRAAYMATFFTAERAEAYAREHGWEVEPLKRLLPLAHGNHPVITRFLESVPQADRQKALLLLQSLSDKDLCDITAEVLADAMTTPMNPDLPLDVWQRYVLCPRIGSEQLTPWRTFFAQSGLGDNWEQWITTQLTLDNNYDFNPSHVIISPQKVCEHRRMIDPSSRNVCYVAGMRAAGKPARIDPVTGKVQRMDGKGQWLDVTFGPTIEEKQAPQGTLRLTFDASSTVFTPKYYAHFTLEKIVNGKPQTLAFDDFTPWDTLFAQGRKVDAGQYMLVSGQRMANGSVLAHADIFEVKEGETTVRPLIMRQDTTGIQVIGSFNSEDKFNKADGQTTSILEENGRGYFVVALMAPANEPSVHALNDISLVAEQWEKRPERIFLLYPDGEALSRAKLEAFTGLPKNVVIGTDINHQIADEIGQSLGLDTNDKPVVIIADTFNRVVFTSQGYTIHMGEKLLDVLNRAER